MEVIRVIPRGYCKGVVQAINAVKEARKNYSGNIYILGMIVHNTFVKKALEEQGVISLDISKKSKEEYLDEIDEGMVIFTAHGSATSLITKAKNKGLMYVDACCSDVFKTHHLISEYESQGYTTIYIGKKGHPEAEAVLANFDHVVLVENLQNAQELVLDTDKILITNQTTMSIHDIERLHTYLKEKFPHAIVTEEICNATRLRQEAIASLQDVDVLLVVGDPLSNNSNKLVEINTRIPRKHLISSVEDIDISWFKENDRIAVTSGASTPTYITNQVIDYLVQLDLQDESTYSIPSIEISKIL
ncbi:MAG: 4-hydroxy-3-methylbut-2-enyl diphosphate reductase [Erysipelotrichales bacterium]|nr:4-hydroxy-3-methylbut-2-enyl diphosphate reductase [Erysipelotrichales bacterium]